MAAARTLKVNVVLENPKTGERQVFEAGDDKVPAWAAKLIGDHCYYEEAPARRGSRQQQSADSGDAGDQGDSGDAGDAGDGDAGGATE